MSAESNEQVSYTSRCSNETKRRLRLHAGFLSQRQESAIQREGDNGGGFTTVAAFREIILSLDYVFFGYGHVTFEVQVMR
ncbi:hypothetical protein M6D81_16080 [Paenibacillus sp. J5C_2022]|uniref:hypothetical protein n=1 Tax=Paenibacillus sp. J5C2022 TaxID=2977129 RepID=UPI0021D16629|nr:hypothetical protein [Paenibacillus sp. J5C2022]MCU6710218.1 hypothetical protein [Paenibacillus sp. J5C2022]